MDGPVFVEEKYDCSSNDLTSLFGAPRSCQYFDCEDNPFLTNVSHIWNSEVGSYLLFNLNKNMAILPFIGSQAYCEFQIIGHLISKHLGKGKQNIINFQFDLIENGFEENAMWEPS